MTTPTHTEHDPIEPDNETEAIASDDAAIEQLTVEVTAAKQALAEALEAAKLALGPQEAVRDTKVS